MSSVMIDTRLKRKVEKIYSLQGALTIRFKDIQDAFWFDNETELQEFLNVQVRERYYDKSLRQGFFDYVNENNETYRYYVSSNRGTLTVINEENLGMHKLLEVKK